MEDNKIIMIKGYDSIWYDQAIFVLKRNVPQKKMPVNLVVEAEKIINDYMNKKTRDPNRPEPELIRIGSVASAPRNGASKTPSGGSKSARRRDVSGLVLNICLFISITLLALTLYNIFI